MQHNSGSRLAVSIDVFGGMQRGLGMGGYNSHHHGGMDTAQSKQELETQHM